MAIRVDWPKIRDGIISNQGAIDAPFLFVLPHAGRHLLMAIMDVLRWEATYRYKLHGYDYSDWDELQAIVEATHYGLMDGEEVNQIADAITYLADTLAANMPNLNLEGVDMGNVQQVVNLGCGCGRAITNGGNCGAGIDETPPPDAPVLPPREFPPVEQPPITQTWVDFKCNMSHYLYYIFRSDVMGIADLIATGEANYDRVNNLLDETIGLIVPRGDWAWELYYGIVAWLVDRVTGTSASEMAQEMDRNYDDFICAMYSGDGPEAQSQNVRAVIDNLALGWVERYWIKLIEDTIPYDQIFYQEGWESFEFPPSFVNRSCPCASPPQPLDELPEAPTGYRWIESRYGSMSQTGRYWQNLNVSVSGNEVSVLYNRVRGPGASDGLEYDINRALLDANMPLGIVPVGVLYKRISSSLTGRDTWRLNRAMGTGGSGLAYSVADIPYYFANDAPSTSGDPNRFEAIRQWVTDRNGKVEVRDNRAGFDTVGINANFDEDGATMEVAGWLLVEDNAP